MIETPKGVDFRDIVFPLLYVGDTKAFYFILPPTMNVTMGNMMHNRDIIFSHSKRTCKISDKSTHYTGFVYKFHRNIVRIITPCANPLKCNFSSDNVEVLDGKILSVEKYDSYNLVTAEIHEQMIPEFKDLKFAQPQNDQYVCIMGYPNNDVSYEYWYKQYDKGALGHKYITYGYLSADGTIRTPYPWKGGIVFSAFSTDIIGVIDSKGRLLQLQEIDKYTS